LAVGAAIGLVFALTALKTGILKTSYPMPDDPDAPEPAFNDRIEILKEILFLIPIVAFALAAYLIVKIQPIAQSWENLTQTPAIKGFTGALAGCFFGCAVVWATRILGTLAFGREAMGLGDVHLMGAAGAVIGPQSAVLSFFIAPFFGLGWALYQWIFKKNRQIPYGPFLSFAVFAVIIFHDWIKNFLQNVYGIY
jgi:leader peptidase (prepilin peptidase)/N-methyltransferase